MLWWCGRVPNGAAISGDYIASRWVPFSCRASLSHDATFYLLAPKRRQKVSDRIQSREMFQGAHQQLQLGFLMRSFIPAGDS